MKYVIYYRVSTKKQGASGLGLEAQKTIVENYIKNSIVIAEFTEIETGKSANRPQLNKALECCKINNATLLVAKLDRLARNLNFITSLQASNIDFVCCDMPTANRLTIHIISAIAENEALLISQRTKQALAEKKKQGVKLGNPKNNGLTLENISKGCATRKENALSNEANKKASTLITMMRKGGSKWSEIVKQLNQNGFRTRRGCNFDITAVKRLYNRYVLD
ncbi:recombinase family protein [Dysgonomonas sp. 520]|uniref:recombinase family protein n=1 Tax=Dysgonomonas sp. 520 TaxID=2302931 RepID=UPI0013D1B0E1|nr:recombinase family protein [Dysgonomonas sp. 520]NDW09326.1 resolvase [Dysgonomonas sp. 520]